MAILGHKPPARDGISEGRGTTLRCVRRRKPRAAVACPAAQLPRSVRVDSLATASMAKRTNESFASHTAPGRRRQSAIPAATPIPVMRSRAARKISDSVDRVSILPTAEDAWSARLTGFQIVRITMSSRMPKGKWLRATQTTRRPRQTAAGRVPAHRRARAQLCPCGSRIAGAHPRCTRSRRV